MAALGIAHKVQMIPMQVALGASQGVMPMVGYNYASKDAKRFKDTIGFITKLMLPIMVVVALVCWIFPEFFISLFHKNPDVIRFGALFLRGFAAAMVFQFVDFLAVGVFQSVGMGKQALLFAVLRKIVLEIPAIIVLGRFFGAEGITYSAAVAELALAFAGTLMLGKIVKRVSQDKETAS